MPAREEVEVPTERDRNAAESVEWLAALWELAEGKESQCANPHLLTLLRLSPRVSAHPALACVAGLRREQSRDRLIKILVEAAYGEAAQPVLQSALQSFAAEAEGRLGAGFYGLIRQARDEARQRVEEIAGEMNPSEDLAAVTGEWIPLRVVLSPSVFLPPPQSGRHGALVRQPEEWVAHLFFGFPLRQDPQKFNINRIWLLGGAWHYAIHLYLDRYWPQIAQRLAADRELAEAVTLALGPPQDHRGAPWTEVLRMHVNVALKGLLSQRFGLPDVLHRAFARATGLKLFPWFEEWLRGGGAEGSALGAYISTLPEALAAERPRWESSARAEAGAPPSVNLALLSPSARRACLVVPDEWSDEAAAAAVAGWRLLPLPLLRYGEWARTRAHDANPVIAFGEPGRNPLVRRVLAQRGLSLDTLETDDPAIIALSPPDPGAAAWCIAVAVSRPETAAALRMEMALNETSRYILLQGGNVIDSSRVTLDELAPPVGVPGKLGQEATASPF
jgi:hypothetical protein